MKVFDNSRGMAVAAMMPFVAAAVLLLTAGAIYAQQGGGHAAAQFPIGYIAAGFTAMGTAVAACAGGCWWLLKQYVATLNHAKEREEQLVREMKEAEERHALDISDTIREVMPLVMKLTEYIPTQQKLTASIMELVQELGRRRHDGEARRS